MTAIVTNYFPLLNAISFKDYLSTGKVYVGIGKSSAWTGDPIPDVPVYNSHTTDYSDLIGIKKIVSTNVILGMPRVDWVSGTIYEPNDYVMTDEYKVYLCKAATGSSSTKPTSTTTTATEVLGSYTWQYLYTVQTTDILDFLTTSWIPVYSWNGTSDPSFDSYNPAKTLGCRYVIVNTTFEEANFPLVEYRKIVLIDSPRLNSDGTTLCTASTYATADVKSGSGQIIYKDYRRPIQRAVSQKENISIILEF